MNGAESLVRSLLASGVDTCFANPGTSEMHFVAALDKVAGMRCVLGMAETVVTGCADGYARMTGKPAATLMHCGPGLANGTSNVHNARRDAEDIHPDFAHGPRPGPGSRRSHPLRDRKGDGCARGRPSCRARRCQTPHRILRISGQTQSAFAVRRPDARAGQAGGRRHCCEAIHRLPRCDEQPACRRHRR